MENGQKLVLLLLQLSVNMSPALQETTAYFLLELAVTLVGSQVEAVLGM